MSMCLKEFNDKNHGFYAVIILDLHGFNSFFSTKAFPKLSKAKEPTSRSFKPTP